jgi:hypothetical protein
VKEGAGEVDRIDPEPPEPFMTVAEVLVFGFLTLVALAVACWACECGLADLRRGFEQLFEGLP